MNFLVNCYHPANYLILKNFIARLQSEGHSIHWCIRDKDVIADLMAADGIKYEVLTSPRSGLVGRISELLSHDYKIFTRLWKYNIDFAIGASVSVAHGALLSRAKSVVFNDDDADVVPDFVKLAYPFANWIVTPDCLNENHGAKHFPHPSYHVLAYLHPNHFKSDPNVPLAMGLDLKEPIYVLRFVSLNAFHDTHAKGIRFEDKLRLIKLLEKRGRVVISCEGGVPDEFKRYEFKLKTNQMHSLLAHASLIVTDSQTMTAEAAVLGVPALRSNTFVGKIAYLEELEHRYELTYGFQPQRIETLFQKLQELLDTPNLQTIWQAKRAKMLSEKVDMSQWTYDFFQSQVFKQASVQP